MLLNQQHLQIGVLLFIIYWFFVRPHHTQRADTLSFSLTGFLEQIGLDADNATFKYIMMSVPFLYAMKKELGLEKLFSFLSLDDTSSLVQI